MAIAKSAKDSTSALRLRVLLGNGHMFGPGKAELLEGIATLGSIAAAGRAMSMSYKRAWQLVDDLNRFFGSPLVIAVKGGGKGGGAQLTERGRRVLDLYRAVENKSRRAAFKEIESLRQLAKKYRST
jgi:molybdate transport system regulatory protein